MAPTQPDPFQPLVHSPRSFVAPELVVQFSDPDQPTVEPQHLRWVNGLVRPIDAGAEPDLVIEGPVTTVLAYLTGLVDSDVLFTSSRVRGDVAALSLLHGLTHHPDVIDYWQKHAAEGSEHS